MNHELHEPKVLKSETKPVKTESLPVKSELKVAKTEPKIVKTEPTIVKSNKATEKLVKKEEVAKNIAVIAPMKHEPQIEKKVQVSSASESTECKLSKNAPFLRATQPNMG